MPPWEAGYCAAKVSDGYLRTWLFLARPQGLQELHGSENQHGVLGGQGRSKPRAGPGSLTQAGGERLERHHRLGVSAEEGQPR